MSKPAPLNPRKLPHQKRSEATVNTILEATIQVLHVEGPSRFTTTRVADRAGVSIGTLYQYFPQKRSLLNALLQSLLKKNSDELESACQQLLGQKLTLISDGYADAYFDINTRSFDISKAIFSAARMLDTRDFDGIYSSRTYYILKAVLGSASDFTIPELAVATSTLQQAFAGIMRAAYECEDGTIPTPIEKIRSELKLLARSYLSAVSKKRDTVD